MDKVGPQKTLHHIDPNHWVSDHADYLYSYAIRRLNDKDLAHDLIQDTFLGALEKVGSFQGLSTERTWLISILKFKIIDVYRKRSSKTVANKSSHNVNFVDNFFDIDNGHWNEKHRPGEFGMEDHDPLAKKEFNRIFNECLKKLPSQWLSVFSMKHIDDMDTNFICTELKITKSNYWVLIHRTKVNLRSCLQKNWI
ncbi:RNA polymerase sigma-70 factor (TIGR02943 family) [Pedobacter sp. UYEF25]